MNRGENVRFLLEAGASFDDDRSVPTIEDLAADFEDAQRMTRQGKQTKEVDDVGTRATDSS